MGHEPVLAAEVVDHLLPALEQGGTFVDATLGRAGHARLILEAAPQAHLIGIDRDAAALEASRAYLAAQEDRFVLVRDDFKNLAAVLERLGHPPLRGVLLDLGVSSPQLDEADRGFSYRHNGPLDMRMDTSQPFSAADVVNGYSEAQLERVIRTFGEERFARRIARRIVAARPIEGTAELADIVKEAIPAATRRTGGHPAKRTFQALRLEVNGELDALTKVLPVALDALEAGGRMAVLSYHSLEDRRVKRFFQDEARGCVCPPDFPVCTCGAKARVRLITRRGVVASDEEIERNPRAKSARLRVAERVMAA
ncbi:MAG: rRNA (cytosine1402-N4)-methyltransferase [Actinomycetota bacterium]|jgi:16S rRNA (cytosine1402-N4)-methyltransferase|nr:rRNA (cytosine1402-N4)-methyltransferase [Actinomycetota bacterium]